MINSEILNKMDWSKQYKYKGKNIKIHHETNEYIICSVENGGKFKIDKKYFNNGAKDKANS